MPRYGSARSSRQWPSERPPPRDPRVPPFPPGGSGTGGMQEQRQVQAGTAFQAVKAAGCGRAV